MADFAKFQPIFASLSVIVLTTYWLVATFVHFQEKEVVGSKSLILNDMTVLSERFVQDPPAAGRVGEPSSRDRLHEARHHDGRLLWGHRYRAAQLGKAGEA